MAEAVKAAFAACRKEKLSSGWGYEKLDISWIKPGKFLGCAITTLAAVKAF